MSQLYNNLNAYQHLSSSFKVRDICKPFISTYDIELSVAQVWDDWFVDTFADESAGDPMDHLALVSKNNKIIGFLFPEDLMADKMIQDVYTQLDPEIILSSDTTIIEFAKIVSTSEHNIYFVIHANEFVGWVSYRSLNKAPFHLCLLTLILALEQYLLFVLLTSPKAAFENLSDGRKEKAKNLHAFKRYGLDENGQPYLNDLLECTLLIDKIEMVRLHPDLKEFFPAAKNRKTSKIAEETRNRIAHPTQADHVLEKIGKKEIWPLIFWINELSEQSHKYLIDKTIQQ